MSQTIGGNLPGGERIIPLEPPAWLPHNTYPVRRCGTPAKGAKGQEPVCELLGILALRMLATKAFQVGGPFTLASGAVSDHYYDVKRVLLDPEGLEIAAHLVAYDLHTTFCECLSGVGGPELGAIPWVGAVVARLAAVYPSPNPPSGFMVRKAPKQHGTGRLIEGSVKAGDQVAILEDVVTSAGSVERAIDAIEAVGAKCLTVYTVVNRGGDAAEERLARRRVSLRSLFTSVKLRAFFDNLPAGAVPAS
jgi:orotate phosphoribosyltransferase